MKRLNYFIIQSCLVLILLALLNFLAGLYNRYQNQTDLLDRFSWEQLPSFPDKKFAKDLWKEYKSVQSEYASFTEWKHKAFTGKYMRLNEEGERNEPNTVLHRNQPTIHLFGGSTMWGTGAEDKATIPGFIQEMKPQFCVYNHGIQGFNSRQSLEKMINLYTLGKQMDHVIFYDGFNEISMCDSLTETPGHYKSTFYKQQIIPHSKIRLIADIFYNFFIKNIQYMAINLHNRMKNKPNFVTDQTFVCDCDTARTQKIARALVRNWEMAHAIVTSRGGKFIAILHPISTDGNPNTGYIVLDRFPTFDRFQKNMVQLYKAIKAELKVKKYDWIYDFTDTMNGQEPYYVDYVHINDKGNEKIAQRITAIMAEK